MKNLWIFLSFLTMFTSALLVIILKYIDKSNYDNNILISLGFVIIGMCSLFYLLYNSKKIKNHIFTFKRDILYLLFIFCISLICFKVNY